MLFWMSRRKPRMKANRRKFTVLLIGIVGSSAYAQWVNYPAPGTPRTPDGKPNLTAPAPRASNGKPDLSGLWHVQPTPRDEMVRLLGADLIKAADATSVPGMELDTISKYAINILLDFKPEEAPMRPEAAALFAKRARRRERSRSRLPAARHSDFLTGFRGAQDRSDSGPDRDPARSG